MDKQKELGMKRKRKKSSSTSTSWRPAGHKAETHFGLMLASSLSNDHPESIPILKQCLHRLSISLLSKTPNPFLSLFPLLLHSKCAEIAASSLEIMGAASLYSFELNELIASDDQIIKGLIAVVGISNKKRSVALAACNTLLDLSTTSIARQQLLQFSALENLICWFNQVPKCSRALVSIYTEEKGSGSCVRIGFKEDEYLILLLHAMVTLINTCTIEQLEKIPRNISETLLVYLKSLWAEIHKQMLRANSLELNLGTHFHPSKIRPHNLVESIFRLSINAVELNTPSNHKEVKRSIFDLGEVSFEYFMLNHWEVSPLHIRRPSKAITNIFSSFEEFLRPGDVFPSFLSQILQKCISSLPISSDELDVLKFLEEIGDHLGCPIIHKQDIRVLKTQNLNREMHFFSECSGSYLPPHCLYIDDILRCDEAYKEGYSIALRGMEFRFESIAAIADGLASMFGQPSAGINMYLTPPNSQGLARHYDDHCVFVCQLIGFKKWKLFPESRLQLPRLYEPVDSLHDSEGGSMMMDGYTQVLLREGDVLYIPRGCPHEACTDVDNDGPDGNVGFSLHLTLAIEVEPPFEWEGFTHVALHIWCLNQYLSEYSSDDALSWNLNVLAVNLMHIAIKTIGNTDATFRKACLVGAVPLPSFSEGWLDFNQRTVFRHLLNTVNIQSRFTDALRAVEVALQNHEDPLQEIRWLRHLNREGDMLEGQNWNFPLIDTETFNQLVGKHMEKAEAAFMHSKSKFCSEVIFENVECNYKMLLEKYRKARNQYMNGMLSLHCS